MELTVLTISQCVVGSIPNIHAAVQPIAHTLHLAKLKLWSTKTVKLLHKTSPSSPPPTPGALHSTVGLSESDGCRNLK